MKGLVTVFGGSGFVGAQIVRALARRGWRVRVAVRRPGMAYRLPMLGDVGQIEIVQANVRMPESLHRALDGAEACVNAVAILHETGRQKFEALHVEGAAHVAEAAKVQGAERFIQISALGADAASASRYYRTKAEGEAAVRRVIPQATVIRPSVVFGQGDHFFNRFAALATLPSPIPLPLPLIGGGHTRFQPVFVGDVAAAVAAALTDVASPGQTYELGGPGVYSFKALMELMLKEIGRERFLAPVPFWAMKPVGLAGDIVGLATAFTPPITSDQIEMLRSDNVATAGAPGLAELGVAATALEPIIPTYLYVYRKGGQYAGMLEPQPAQP